MALLDEIGAAVTWNRPGRESSPLLSARRLPTSVCAACWRAVRAGPAPATGALTSRTSRAQSTRRSPPGVQGPGNMDRNHRTGWRSSGCARGGSSAHGAHARRHRPAVATKYAQAMFGQERETVDVAYPGDVIGLSTHSLRPRDTLFEAQAVRVPADPELCPGALRRRAQQGREQAQASSQGDEQLGTERRVRSCPPICAVTRPPCSPRSARCSSTWSCPRLEHEFGARAELERPATPWPGGRHEGPPVSPGCAGLRSSPGAWTVRCSPSSRDKWRLAPSSVSTRIPGVDTLGGRHRVRRPHRPRQPSRVGGPRPGFGPPGLVCCSRPFAPRARRGVAAL